jgi:hypothetical protein
MAANLKAFLDNVDDINAFNARTSAAHETTLQDDRAASKKGPQLLSNTLLAPNEHDDAIGNRITSAVEPLEAASARDQAEKARHLDDCNGEGDNADPT